MQKKQWLTLILLLFVIADLSWSFCQYYGKPIDGDMASIVLPAEHLAPVLDDPFGFQILKTGKGHAASNRYFAHQTLRVYFEDATSIFRNFTNPVNAIYLSNALFLWLSHLLLLGTLCRYIGMNFKWRLNTFLIAAVIISPLFQSNGYQVHMGLISGAVSYTSAYGLPLGILLYFFYPFFRKLKDSNYQISLFRKIISIPLILILAFNGPIIPPVGVIISALFIFYYLKKSVFTKGNKQERLTNTTILFCTLFILTSLYSFYIGTFNAENSNVLSLTERYVNMFGNLFPFISQKLGLPLLVSGVILNFIILRKQKANTKARHISSQLKWILFFPLIYLLLLPFGGYRAYRSGIIRHDTFIPIGLGLIYFFGLSSTYLWNQFTLKYKMAYRSIVILLLLIFTNADSDGFDKNRCEKAALHQLASSTETPVQLSTGCKIMSWQKVSEPQYSKVNAALLYRWEVTQDTVLYFNR